MHLTQIEPSRKLVMEKERGRKKRPRRVLRKSREKQNVPFFGVFSHHLSTKSVQDGSVHGDGSHQLSHCPRAAGRCRHSKQHDRPLGFAAISPPSCQPARLCARPDASSMHACTPARLLLALPALHSTLLHSTPHRPGARWPARGADTRPTCCACAPPPPPPGAGRCGW